MKRILVLFCLVFLFFLSSCSQATPENSSYFNSRETKMEVSTLLKEGNEMDMMTNINPQVTNNHLLQKMGSSVIENNSVLSKELNDISKK